jgi:hypothetical protein
MEKSQSESVITPILKELLLCSVMTKANVLESLLDHLMERLVVCVGQLNANGLIVPQGFYLPAPPIYCAQMDFSNYYFDEERNGHLVDNENNTNVESNLRMRLSALSKCICVLFSSSNLHVPLIKWYLEQLNMVTQFSQ